MVGEPLRKIARFVIWHGSSQIDESEEHDLLLQQLGLRDLSELQGFCISSLPPALSEETAFFLEYTGQGKLCIAVPQGLQRSERLRDGILAQSVAALRLSVRASNCLKHAGIQTMAELMRWAPEDLGQLPNMGRKTLGELESALAAKGISAPSPDAMFQINGSSASGDDPLLAEGEFFLDTLLTLDQSGISGQLTSRLELHGILTLGHLVKCQPGKLRKSADLTSDELVELAGVLRRRGLYWSTSIPAWQVRHWFELFSAFSRELRSSIDKASILPSEPVLPPVVQEIANSLTDELEMLFPPKTDERNRMIVKAYWGLSGEPPLTLEETAQRYNLTRERVRQIGKSFYQSLCEFGRQLPWLEEALTILKTLCPCLAEEAEETLKKREIIGQIIRTESLLKLGRQAGFEHTLVIEGEKRLLLDSGMVETLRSALSYAGKMVSHWGVAERSEVLTAASCSSSDKLAKLIWYAIPGLIWLDTEERFLWIPTGQNAVENRLRSILNVAPDLELSKAYEGVLRDGRIPRERLPFRIFPALCKRYSWCAVTEDRLKATSELPFKGQDSNDDIIAGFLRKTSGIGWRDDLWDQAKAAGIGKANFDRILSDSSIIVRLSDRLYGLIGTSPPEVQRDLQVGPQEKRSSSDTESRPEADPLELSGVLAGCDLRSGLFPFQIAAAIWKKSESFGQAWSLSELMLTRSEVEAVRLWGRLGTWDVRRDTHKTESVGQLRVKGLHALCVMFLLFCSEVAREDAIEGELWPAIKSALNGPLRQALFGQLAAPKIIIRDGTEDVCRLLRLRHVFGRDGEQSWMRTVFLQFGFTRRGIKNFDRWLMVREHLPVAVDDLLDSSRGLKSDSFGSIWQTLQELRWHTIDIDRATEKLTHNPWLRVEDQALAFSEAQSSRFRESHDDEGLSADRYHLLVDKRLRLSPEPHFEFHLNPIPPTWCKGERYTLEVGPQRLSISRSDNGWEFDHAQVLCIPLAATTTEVDLTQRRQSVMRQKLLLNLAPVTDIAFYDLNSGLEIGLDQLSNRSTRGTAILYKSVLRVQPESLEFVSVFCGAWKLAAFRHGLPQDLSILDGEHAHWKPASTKAESKSRQEFKISVHIDNGWWGDEVGVSVFCPVESDLQPRTLLIAGQVVFLTPRRTGEWRGKIILSPEQDGRGSAAAFCEEDGWIRRHFVAVPDPQSAGVAIEGEDGWITLTAQSNVDTRWLRSRRILVRPPAHEGIRKNPREWALLEGDRLIARPGHHSEPLCGLEALGEELSLAYGPYNNQEPRHGFARSVLDSGCIDSALDNGLGQWTIGIIENMDLGPDHTIWVWRIEDDAPRRLERSAWEAASGQIVCNALPGRVVGFAVAYQGIRLGSKLIDGGWTWLRNWLESCRDWKRAAEWLRWWRVPVRCPEIRESVEARARRQPIETMQAWLTESIGGSGVRQIETYEESWQSMTRACLWGWQPNAPESAALLKALDLWTGDFQSDAECKNFGSLLATNPMLLAQTARNGAPLLYEGAEGRELAALIRCLRNRILEPPDGVRWDDVYHATCVEAAMDLNVDERFLQKSIVEDARRYVRGDSKDQRNLKLALGSMLLRRIVGSRLLEDTAEEWTKQ